MAFLDMPSDRPLPLMIEASSISFGYRRGDPVIEAWSGTIRGGEAVAILGASGTGKSTLLYLLAALVRPWSGWLRIGGVDVSSLGDRSRSDIRAALVGLIFQDALLDPRRSVLANVIEGAVYRGDDPAGAEDAARDLLRRLGVDIELARRATDLSGGQAQRIGLARALLGDPPVILADEPTASLDRANAAVVEETLIERAGRGSAVVIATHDEVLAARCDRVLVLQ